LERVAQGNVSPLDGIGTTIKNDRRAEPGGRFFGDAEVLHFTLFSMINGRRMSDVRRRCHRYAAPC
jgi:hypothetical protein